MDSTETFFREVNVNIFDLFLGVDLRGLVVVEGGGVESGGLVDVSGGQGGLERLDLCGGSERASGSLRLRAWELLVAQSRAIPNNLLKRGHITPHLFKALLRHAIISQVLLLPKILGSELRLLEFKV